MQYYPVSVPPSPIIPPIIPIKSPADLLLCGCFCLAALSGDTVGGCVDPRTGAGTPCAPAETTMASASWNGQVVASFSGEHPSVDGNVYFPADSLDMQYFKPSTHTSRCPYKGTASYFDVVVDGQVNKNAAWVYKTPKSGMEKIANHVAFWKGVWKCKCEFTPSAEHNWPILPVTQPCRGFSGHFAERSKGAHLAGSRQNSLYGKRKRKNTYMGKYEFLHSTLQ